MLVQIVCSYDSAKIKKIGNFFALTWLIFAGPVTYIKYQGYITKDLANIFPYKVK